jgi:hypothetical protein
MLGSASLSSAAVQWASRALVLALIFHVLTLCPANSQDPEEQCVPKVYHHHILRLFPYSCV